jgi:hypothetical protein
MAPGTIRLTLLRLCLMQIMRKLQDIASGVNGPQMGHENIQCLDTRIVPAALVITEFVYRTLVGGQEEHVNMSLCQHLQCN